MFIGFAHLLLGVTSNYNTWCCRGEEGEEEGEEEDEEEGREGGREGRVDRYN